MTLNDQKNFTKTDWPKNCHDLRPNEGNVILTGGLVLQDATIWAEFIENLVIPHNNASELYFEENNIEEFAQKLDESPYDIEYVNRLMTHSWGQKVIRFYDPDGNLIEVGTP